MLFRSTTTMNVDPQALMKAAQQVDFTKMIPADLMEKVQKGDAAALLQVINTVGQGSYAQATAANAKIVEAALNRQAEKFMSEVLPQVLKQHQIGTQLAAENPLFNNPAVAPMLDMVKQQLTIKFPSASPQEITSKAQEYLTGFAAEIAGSQGKQLSDIPKPSSGSGGTDWEKFFS